MRRRKCKITFVAHGATVHSEENIFSDKEIILANVGNGDAEIKVKISDKNYLLKDRYNKIYNKEEENAYGNQ